MTSIETIGVAIPATALVYGAYLSQVADVLQAQGDTEKARQALHIAQIAAMALLVAAAATRGIGPAIASALTVGAVAFYWDRYVLA